MMLIETRGVGVERVYFAGDDETSVGTAIAPLNNIVSFALCEVGNPGRFFYTELKLLFPQFWDWRAEEIHGISRHYLQHFGKDPRTEMEAAARWVQSVARGRIAVYCATPVWFDYGNLEYYFRHFGIGSPFQETLDGRDQYRAIHGLSAKSEVPRMDMWREFPTTIPHTHHALSDTFEYEEVVAGMLRAQGLL